MGGDCCEYGSKDQFVRLSTEISSSWIDASIAADKAQETSSCAAWEQTPHLRYDHVDEKPRGSGKVDDDYDDDHDGHDHDGGSGKDEDDGHEDHDHDENGHEGHEGHDHDSE